MQHARRFFPVVAAQLPRGIAVQEQAMHKAEAVMRFMDAAWGTEVLSADGSSVEQYYYNAPAGMALQARVHSCMRRHAHAHAHVPTDTRACMHAHVCARTQARAHQRARVHR